MSDLSRRSVLRLLSTGFLVPFVAGFGFRGTRDEAAFRIRTITAGIELDSPADLETVRDAIDFLKSARKRFEDAGYVVQTIRIATQPLPRYAAEWMSDAVLEQIVRLDQLATENDVMFNLGPVIPDDGHPDGFGDWAARVIQKTVNTLFTVNIASETAGIHERSIRAAAEAISAIGRATAGGEGNFRFAAIAHSPVGTPFYPAAFHEGPPSFAIGLESPNVLTKAVSEGRSMASALDAVLRPIEALGLEVGQSSGRLYGGIDCSPAPGIDASIGETIETMTGMPFGSSSTLSACAKITDAIQSVSVKTCGYNGLMLPPLEDPILAQRLGEGRYGVQELLLYSSVCGTGLDVVPLPGSTTVDQIADLLRDVAALAHKWDKPLSARLFPVPGKEVGDEVTFENPFLVDARVTAP